VLGTQHDAIDIPVDQGTDIIAPMDGYVQYILPPVSGGYSYMAIKHPNGYVTVYGHLSEVLVYPYQFITK
jgi:murein DD-endopeptidase MepM/ murein hydrolase activator NlpD